MKIVPLTNIKSNGVAKIVNISDNIKGTQIYNHLQEVGFIKDRNIFMTNNYKDMFIVKIENQNSISIAKNIADAISVEAEDSFITSTAKKQKNSFFSKLKNLFKKIKK